MPPSESTISKQHCFFNISDSAISIPKGGGCGSLSFDDGHLHHQLETDYASSAGFDSDVTLDESLNHSDPQRKRLAHHRGSNLTESAFRIVGKLLASIEYNETEKILHVLVHKACGLGGERRENPDISSFVKLYLIPGKKQKHKSTVIRGTKDPEFEEHFNFTHLSVDAFSGQKLKFKLYNSMVVRDEFLGEAVIFLGNIDTKEKEVYHLDLLKRKSKVIFL